jgi:hypothetical protein
MIKEKKEQSKIINELKKFAKAAIEALSAKSTSKANQRDISKRLNQGSFNNCTDMVQFDELCRLFLQETIVKDWPNKEEAELLNKAYQEGLLLKERLSGFTQNPPGVTEAKEVLKQMIVAKVKNPESRSTFQKAQTCSRSSLRIHQRPPNPELQPSKYQLK